MMSFASLPCFVALFLPRVVAFKFNRHRVQPVFGGNTQKNPQGNREGFVLYGKKASKFPSPFGKKDVWTASLVDWCTNTFEGKVIDDLDVWAGGERLSLAPGTVISPTNSRLSCPERLNKLNRAKITLTFRLAWVATCEGWRAAGASYVDRNVCTGVEQRQRGQKMSTENSVKDRPVYNKQSNTIKFADDDAAIRVAEMVGLFLAAKSQASGKFKGGALTAPRFVEKWTTEVLPTYFRLVRFVERSLVNENIVQALSTQIRRVSGPPTASADLTKALTEYLEWKDAGGSDAAAVSVAQKLLDMWFLEFFN